MKSIVQFGGIPWTFRQQRPQMMAKLLAKHYPLVYVDANLSNEGVTRVGNQLYLGSLRGSGLVRHALRIDPKEVADSLNAVMKMLNIDKPIFLFDYPYWQPILKYTKPYKILYNCMDDYTEFSDLNVVKDIIDAQEVELFKSSDLVYCTSIGLYEKAKKYSDNVVIIRNGCNWENLGITSSKPKDLPYGKIVGYVGAIAEWFNQEIVANLSAKLPHWNFVLIGNSSVNIEALRKRENIFLYGEQKHEKAMQYMRHFDVGIIPFNENLPIMKACNAVKYYEYCAAGKPIVSSPLNEIIELKRQGKVIYISESLENWPNRVQEAYKDSLVEGFSEIVRNQVKKDTWDQRVNHLVKEIKKLG